MLVLCQKLTICTYDRRKSFCDRPLSLQKKLLALTALSPKVEVLKPPN